MGGQAGSRGFLWNAKTRRTVWSRWFQGSLSGIGFVGLIGGCGGNGEVAGKACGTIVGGENDLTRSGVVALLNAEGRLVCSATLVGRAADQAVFLSAAHCLRNTPVEIAVGSDFRAPTQSLPIVAEIEHPAFDYATGAYDFVLLVTDQPLHDLLVLETPLGRDDGLSAGSELHFVGFGEDETGDQNSQRKEVVGIVDTLTPTSVEYEQELGGPCAGDSGGPAIFSNAGHNVVVAVTSFGAEGCRSRGTSARVVAAREFIDAEIDQPSSDCR
jgi:hypothetical protein